MPIRCTLDSFAAYKFDSSCAELLAFKRECLYCGLAGLSSFSIRWFETERRLMWSLSFILLLVASAIAFADDPLVQSRSSSAEQRLAFAKIAAESYHFRLGDAQASPVKLSPDPLLRWNNKVVREDDGFLFIWTEGEKGRPIAAAQFFVVDTVWHHEFQSLTANRFQARCDLRKDHNWTWQPTSAGIDFTDANDVDASGNSPAVRLRQMKAMADRFSAAVDMNEDFSAPEQLRLLTTPVYRYSSKDHRILDGAIFSFVQGTNPEILVVIEAEGNEGAAHWRYGFARMSSYNLRVVRNQSIVWSKVRAPVPTADSGSAYQFRLGVQTDGSANLTLPEPAK